MAEIKKVSYEGLYQERYNARGMSVYEDKRLYLSEKHIGKYALVNLTTKVVYCFGKNLKKIENTLNCYKEGNWMYDYNIKFKNDIENRLAKGEKVYSGEKRDYQRMMDCFFAGNGLELVEII